MIPKDDFVCLRSEAAIGQFKIYQIGFIYDNHAYLTHSTVQENQTAIYKIADYEDVITISKAFELALEYAANKEEAIINFQQELWEYQEAYRKDPDGFITSYLENEC